MLVNLSSTLTMEIGNEIRDGDYLTIHRCTQLKFKLAKLNVPSRAAVPDRKNAKRIMVIPKNEWLRRELFLYAVRNKEKR